MYCRSCTWLKRSPSTWRRCRQVFRGFATSTGSRTYYDILEITPKAKKEEIKEAYRRLAKKYHPDRNVDDPEAETRFKEVQEAHATLNDSWKKALYDQDLQFSKFGTNVSHQVDREQWTEHWEKETPEERQARKERYERYAKGERNDLPRDHLYTNLWPLTVALVLGGTFYLCVKAKCRKSKHFIVHYSIVGAFERQSQKCLLEECSLRVMLPNSRPPQESSEDIVSGKLLERVHKNSFLYSDGAKAWPAVAKRMQKGFKVKQVSHRKQEFVRKSKKQIAGTQVADSRWKRLQKWIPATVKTLRRGKVNPELLKYIRSWQFRQMHARAEYLKILGQSLHG